MRALANDALSPGRASPSDRLPMAMATPILEAAGMVVIDTSTHLGLRY
jgi:hypothetical protein